jgi:ribosomal protein S24E
LGGINDNDIHNMSGGWSRQFNLLRRSDIVIKIVFQLEIASNFEFNEISQVLCSIDGTLASNGTVSYLAQLFGDGDNNGGNMVIGFRTIYLSVPKVAIGSHTIVVDGHLSRKTFKDEIS